MSSVLNGSSIQQTSNMAVRGNIAAINAQIKDLNNTIDKLIDVIREIAIKTDVSMDLIDNSIAKEQNVAPPVIKQPAPVVQQPPVLSGNMRRRR
jgi:hypothetical protein